MFDKELEIAKNIAYLSGKIMLEYFDGDQQREHKADGSEVTIADININRLVIEELSKHFHDGVIGEEESTAEYGGGRRWFCDPIDGTKAFVQGLPTATFSLALVEDGRPVVGVVYDPFLDKLYYGQRGQGSYCNAVKLEVSKLGIDGSFVGINNHFEKIIKNPGYFEKLVEMGAKTTPIHGTVYKGTLVARGKFVGFIEPGTNAHDVAAIEVIVEEAGGKISGVNGESLDYSQPFRNAIVSNGVVHEQMVNCGKLLNF
ncbi:inositol monophosphatase [Candidatus Parcubacteria bacterium]|nr:inositol monophosphatase [Candidatus Parcubacteria bacterium]